MTAGYSLNELMVAAIARELRDDELGFVGTGSSGRAFSLAVGIPIVAARLAQLQHAPGFTIYWGNLISPDLEQMPNALVQRVVTNWPAASSLTCADKCDMLTRGRFDVSFESAPQIDMFGNLNITAIGLYESPRVRLVGCLAQPEHLAFVRRPIIVADLGPRTFVERVDFITSVGFLEGGDSRERAGLRGGGPSKVITDRAIFDFDEQSRRMRVVSIHPGQTRESVQEQMGFAPVWRDPMPITPEPSPETVQLIRQIDPQTVFLGADARSRTRGDG